MIPNWVWLCVMVIVGGIVYYRRDDISRVLLQLGKHQRVDFILRKKTKVADQPQLSFAYSYNRQKQSGQFILQNKAEEPLQNITIETYEESPDGSNGQKRQLYSEDLLDPMETKVVNDASQIHFEGCIGVQQYIVSYSIGEQLFVDNYGISHKHGGLDFITSNARPRI